MEVQAKITEKDLPQTFTVKLLGRRPSKGLWGIKNTRQPVDDMINEARSQSLSLPIVKLQVSKEGIIISHFLKKIPTKSNACAKTDEKTDCNSNIIYEQPNKKSLNMLESLKNIKLFASRKKCHKNANEEINSGMFPQTKFKDEKKCPEPNGQHINFSLLEELRRNMQYKHDESFFGIDTISYGVQDLVFTRVFSMIVVSEDADRSRFHCYAFICEDRQVTRAITYSLAAAFQVYSRSIKIHRPVVFHTPIKITKPKILSIDLRTLEEKGNQQKDSEA